MAINTHHTHNTESHLQIRGYNPDRGLKGERIYRAITALKTPNKKAHICTEKDTLQRRGADLHAIQAFSLYKSIGQ
jgi:hypothetical protein